MAILQKHIYICLPDRDYVQEDSCLPDQSTASLHEDLADTVPLAHDDLGCPIRRDRLYQDNMGATAKSLSGPPVSPSLFRSPRSNAPERPSPIAIQASIKESATLAAAISMQWKEEVSAMRRELADLRRDLCKELRAFNSNFNTFTQHYNTWSPQGGNMTAGADVGFGGGTVTESRPMAGGFGASAPGRATGGAREKRPHISKVSVGTQAKSKVLVRQSTADAAVNCPDEKEEKKGGRRNLPKQLSMDPSILACPQPMYVESAIPLSLDPILPGSTRAVEPEPLDLTALPFKPKAEPEQPHHSIVSSPDAAADEPITSQGAVLVSSKTAAKSPQESVTVGQEMLITDQLVHINQADEKHSNIKASYPGDLKSQSSGLIETDHICLPYPVPVVNVSPPEENDQDIISDSECLDPVTVDKPDPVSQDTATAALSHAGLEDSDPGILTELEPDLNIVSVSEYPLSVFHTTTLDLESVTSCNLETNIKCPSIVVSEYLDTDSPASPTDCDTQPSPIITIPDNSDPTPEQMTSISTLASSSTESQISTETESQDADWPPLPEPLDTTPIYHADLVHFDLVMLTSLDQDDLDSVFMDPEPEPFDLSVDSLSNADDLEQPVYQSDGRSSPVPIVDPATLCSLDPSQTTESACLGPAMEYHLAHMPQDAASELHNVLLSQVTVTISPPSSASPDTSLEMDFRPTSPSSVPPPEVNQSTPENEDVSSGDVPHREPEATIVETKECMAKSREYGEQAERETQGSPEKSTSEQAFLWYWWQKRGQRRASMHRSASVELWNSRYEYNSAEITYVSLTL